ncbi:LysR family transcriptional regulator [Aminobacter sp. SR38]|jgi:DNA-binding transcriptional LysR family regulator|nr:LysR family transcriptional regulator [Aminobacter sp. SR38]QOF70636.1 LysR family transcriptional regulator [Aminobacter sp. SR38]
MNLAQIRYFLTLAETLNFTDAARLCGVAQPTLTRAIQKLEHELGGTLVYRDGKDTRLTSLGSDVREEFAAIVGAEDRIRASVNSRISGRRERLNLGIAHSVAPAPISRFITHALGEMPMLEILLHPIDGKMGSGLLLAGTLDGVFLADKPADNTKLSVIELFSERLMLACASSHRLAKFDMVPPEEIGVESYLDRLGCDFRSGNRLFHERRAGDAAAAAVRTRGLDAAGRRRWRRHLPVARILRHRAGAGPAPGIGAESRAPGVLRFGQRIGQCAGTAPSAHDGRLASLASFSRCIETIANMHWRRHPSDTHLCLITEMEDR